MQLPSAISAIEKRSEHANSAPHLSAGCAVSAAHRKFKERSSVVPASMNITFAIDKKGIM